jgi:hypothetical protein
VIHRFVDLLEVVLRPIWPVMATQGSPSNFQSVFLVGGAILPVRLNQTLESIDGVTFLSDPNLSPDETEVVYGVVNDPAGATPTNAKVYVAPSDGSTKTLVVQDPDVPFSSNTSIGPSWNLDGTMIIFISNPSTITGNGTIKRVNRDGTGLTTLHTYTGGRGFHCTYSPSGDYILFTRRDGDDIDNAQIWVMEDDGSNPTKIHDSTNPFVFGEKFFPAWQRGADVFAWHDPGVGFYTSNPDGSSKTLILSEATNLYQGTGIYSWLSDDSGIVTLNNTTGELTVVDAGGGVTGLGVTSVVAHDIWVAATSVETRIYYSKLLTSPSSRRVLHSCAEDGSDERIDMDQLDFSPAAVHHGIYGRDAN